MRLNFLLSMRAWQAEMNVGHCGRNLSFRMPKIESASDMPGGSEYLVLLWPPATRNRNPSAHSAAEVIGAIIETMGTRYFGVVKDEYAVSKGGMNLFGVLDLDTAASCPSCEQMRKQGVRPGKTGRACKKKGSEQEFDKTPNWRGFQDFAFPPAVRAVCRRGLPAEDA